MTDGSEFTARQRIERRLRFQHARWLAEQPSSKDFWFRFERRCWRTFYRCVNPILAYVEPLQVMLFRIARAAYACAGHCIPESWKLSGTTKDRIGACVVFACFGFLFCMLQLAVVAEADGLLGASLVSLACWLTAGIMALLTLSVTEDRPLPQVRRVNPAPASLAFIRSVMGKRRLLAYPLLASVGLAGIAIVSATYELIRMPNGFLAVAAAVLALSATMYATYRSCLSIMRYRRSTPTVQTWGLLAMFSVLILGWGVTANVESSLSLLKFLGPIGWLFSKLMQVGDGNVGALLPIAVYCLGVAFVGWIVARHAGTWSNRRLLLNARYVSIDAAEEKISQQLDAASIKRRLRQELNRQQPRNWRCWLGDQRYSIKILNFLYLPILSYQFFVLAFIVWMQSLLSQEFAKLMFPVVFMPAAALFFIEGEALFRTGAKVERRPVSALRYWLTKQWIGLRRIPAQLILVFPIIAVAAFAVRIVGAKERFVDGLGVDISYALILHALLQVCSLLVLVRSAFVCWELASATGSLVPWWVGPLACVSLIPLMPLLVVLCLSHLNPWTFGIMNLVSLPVLFFMRWLRDGGVKPRAKVAPIERGH